MRSFASLVALSTPVPDSSVPGVDAEEGELADERVGHDLEDQPRERLPSSAERSIGLARCPARGPATGGMSTGDGR